MEKHRRSRSATAPVEENARIAADLRGRRLDAHYDTGRPDLGILRAMSRRARRTLVYVLGSARPGQEAGTNLTNSR